MHNVSNSPFVFTIPDEHKKASGIYIIRNLINSKVYVGSAVCLRKRYRSHLGALIRGAHSNIKLQNAVRKYGLQSFSFDLLELCSLADLVAKEQEWLDRLEVVNTGYNIAPVAGSVFGLKATEETKKKMSIARMGRICSTETRKKISEAHTGMKRTHSQKGRVVSADTKARISLANKGRKHSEESRYNMSTSKKGRIVTEETRVKISLANKGKVRTDEHNKANALAQTGKKWNPDSLQKRILSQTGKKRSEETKMLISIAAKAREQAKRATH